jgi:Holliday junction resolvase RusA-like endonuclease
LGAQNDASLPPCHSPLSFAREQNRCSNARVLCKESVGGWETVWGGIGMTEIRFTVLGRPQGKGSKRAFVVKGRPVVADTNSRARPWAARVAAAARDAYQGELMRDAVEVELRFFFARPKAHFGTGRNAGTVLASAPRHMIVMPDADKLARCALDPLTGVVFKDDAQITRLVAVKGYGEPERLEVIVR